jgi:nucleotide-binding universal stress UspA family protein
MRILAAIDDSTFASAIAAMLATEVKTAGTTVKLLHVVEPAPTKVAEAVGSPEYPDFMKAKLELTERATTLLQEVAARLRAAGFSPIEVSILEGDPRTVILDEAQAWKADLIVLGSHGRTGIRRWLMGSVSDAVARHATCSVEIVRVRADTE